MDLRTKSIMYKTVISKFTQQDKTCTKKTASKTDTKQQVAQLANNHFYIQKRVWKNATVLVARNSAERPPVIKIFTPPATKFFKNW